MYRSFVFVALLLFTFSLVARAAEQQLSIEEIIALAEQNNADAQAILGAAYLIGRFGLTQDHEQGIKWTTRAAKQNNASAQFTLGSAYLIGHFGLTQDNEQGIKWLTRAAKQNNVLAQLRLGKVYFYGIYGLSQDNVKAHMWLNLAHANDPELEGLNSLQNQLNLRMTPQSNNRSAKTRKRMLCQ